MGTRVTKIEAVYRAPSGNVFLPISVRTPAARKNRRHVAFIISLPRAGEIGDAAASPAIFREFAKAGYHAAGCDLSAVRGGRPATYEAIEPARAALHALKEKFPGYLVSVIGVGLGCHPAAQIMASSAIRNGILIAPEEHSLYDFDVSLEIVCGALLVIAFADDATTYAGLGDKYFDAAAFMSDRDMIELPGKFREILITAKGPAAIARVALDWMSKSSGDIPHISDD